MHRFFAATGRFAVRFRWAVVAAWVTATVLASLFLPSLTSVAQQNNTDMLPVGSPSLHAAQLATPFQGPNQSPVLVVVFAIRFTTVVRLSSGRPRQFLLMYPNSRCSILFHLLVPGGKWQTLIAIPNSSANPCSSTFHNRVR